MTSSQDDRTIIRPLAAFRLTVRGPSGRTFQTPLLPGVLTVGRDETCGLPLDPADVSVSRRHASFTLAGETLTVTDLGSTNGVYVNKAMVQQAVLRPGDEVRLGQTVLTIESALPAPPAQPAAGAAHPQRPGRHRRLGLPPKVRLSLAAAALAALLLGLWLALFTPSPPSAPVPPGPEEQSVAATDGPPPTHAVRADAPQPADTPAPTAEAVEKAKDCSRQGLFFYNNNNLVAAMGEWEKALALDPQNAQAAKWLAKAEGERDQLVDKYAREGATALKYARLGEAREAFRLAAEYCRGQSMDERCREAARQLEQLEGKAP